MHKLSSCSVFCEELIFLCVRKYIVHVCEEFYYLIFFFFFFFFFFFAFSPYRNFSEIQVVRQDNSFQADNFNIFNILGICVFLQHLATY